MAITDRAPKLAAGFLSLLLLAGCGAYRSLSGDQNLAEGQQKADRLAMLGQMPWVPLSLSRESFVAAEQRLSRDVKLGMPRADFLKAMKLTPLGEGDSQVVMGDGWMPDISARNTAGGAEIEEYAFGYMESYRLKERFAVVVEKGKVARIVRSGWPEGHSPPGPPAELTASSHTLEEENRMIRDFYRARLQGRDAFERIRPHLRRIRSGWTSAELRLALGGSMFRLSNGYVYFQESLLWDQGFTEQSSGGVSVVILPFGYRTADGRVHTQAIVRAEGGVVSAVFWQDVPGASVPPRAGQAPAGR
ncbi:MAG: hypothetical protein A3J27_14420 [Candidatus Tectomicrobia bacterium RIFCSPLOWO2_12_FULL_69_37]|nr:MAG: hypothetical protein A3I72_14205 [Candidatus Tectomicrobia bacterium RIFCSPLOWO2_02_FULL_70_19]OGL62757.1 MAG: hypothetical protein A3J27_14420 [Candidatus Tectomicrobia bacterium RIFCSPLOWO2_12_FULL_69_37]